MGHAHSFGVLGALAGVLVSATIASAAGAAGLVVEIGGGQIQGLQPFSELADGTTVTVPAGVRLVFQHYLSCRKVAVVGGTVAVSSEGYTVTGGSKESDVKVPCPRRVALKTSGEGAGVLLRSVSPGPTLSTRPAIALIGPRADAFKSIKVSQGDTVVLEAALDGRGFTWPSTAAPLAAGTQYTLELIPAAAGTPPMSTRFMTRRPSAVAAEDNVTLIAVE